MLPRQPHDTTSHTQREWQVLLLGGASGVGKTAIARTVARRLDLALSQVDGYRLMLERSTTADAHPAIHGYRVGSSDTIEGQELCDRWIGVAKEVSRALEIVVAFHAATKAATLFEGDTITPALAASRVLAGVPVLRRVRSVFLHEPDEARLAARLETRGRGYQLLSPAARRREVHRNMAYSQWLADEAERHGCPVLIPSDGPDAIDATAARVVHLLTS